MLNFDSRHDADGPTSTESQVAWSEVDETGVRVIRTKYWDPWGWHAITGDVRADPSASADSPSLSLLLAFLETSPGGVPQARAARTLMGLEPFPGSLNLDPTASASQPAASVDLPSAVAWVESGRVLARIADDPSVSLTFGPAAILNVDATRPARSPRGAPGAVFFFAERAADGDEIWARRWDGTEWRLLPGPVNAPGSGPVRFIATSLRRSLVSPRPAVAWVDDGGAVRLRVANW